MDDDGAAPAAEPSAASPQEPPLAAPSFAMEPPPDDAEVKEKAIWKDDCLRIWSIVPRLTGTFAWSIAVAFLFDCRFVYLDFTKILSANTSQVIVAEPLRFGLLSHAAVELTRVANASAATLPPGFISDNGTGGGGAPETEYWLLHSTDECLRYSERLQATQEFATAQVCAIACVVLGGVLSWLLWLLYCCRFVCLCVPSVIISLGFLVVLPVLQGVTLFMVRSVCRYRLDQPPLQDLVQSPVPVAAFDVTFQEATCGMSQLYGLYYPVSIAMWIVTGILFLAIRPKKNSDLDAVFMLR